MKEIQLSQDKVALVDDEDYDWLNQWKWYICTQKKTSYVLRIKERKTILMHRQIMNAQKGELIDHKDGNGLNNQKSNLRKCTRSQNNANRHSFGSSKYLGVCKATHTDNGKIYIYWHANIKKNQEPICLGIFKSEIDAAKAYDKKAKELHGEFARLNFPDE